MGHMSTVMQHRQVVLLISGLMSDPSPIIHLVCEYWVKDGKKSAGKTLIEAMFHEAGLPVPKDLLHNQWINYYNHSEGLIKDTSPVYIPSRWYSFINMKAKVSCNIQQGDTDVPVCTMSIIDPHITVTEDLLSVCHRICQHQAVKNLYLYMVGCKDLPEPHVFTISKNTESMGITFCQLPTETLSHLMQQINQCDALRVLDLSGTTLTGRLSSFLPDPHPGLPELETLNLIHTALNKEDLQHLSHITQSNKLPKLKVLDLSKNALTGCLASFVPDPHSGLLELENLDLRNTALSKDDLQYLSHTTDSNKLPKLTLTLDRSHNSFLPDPHPELPELETLKLRYTGLNKEDLQHLSHITQYNKLPKLRSLDLSDNTLTACLTSFLPDPHPGLLELRELDLENTELNKEDLQHLSYITQYNKLPSLKCLDLSWHILTGCLTSFLPDPHPGLPELEKLNLERTALNKEDLQHLTHLIQTHKLPGLKDLNLWRNRLSEMETDFEHLIEACVNHHQRELKLRLWYNSLYDDFEKKWEQRCAGTKIILHYGFM